MGFLVDRLVDSGIEYHLGEAFPIPEINENNTTVIPSSQDPSH
jgi:hypothetical protein